MNYIDKREIKNLFDELRKFLKKEKIYRLNSYQKYNHNQLILNDEFKIRKKNDYNIDLKSDLLIHNIKENEYIKENQIDISISYKEDEEENQIISIIYDEMIISDINLEFYYISDLFEMIYQIIYNFLKKYIKDYEIE